MKKLFCVLLTLAVLLSLAACTESKDSDSPKRPVAPEGYTLYDDAGITFAYPENWTKTESGTIVLLMSAADATTNITVSSEPKSDLYSKMDEASFNTNLKPSLETAGMTLTNVKISQTHNDYTKLTKITYSAAMQGIDMQQTLFIVASGDLNYVVNVTLLAENEELVNTVANTVCSLK